MLRKRKFIMDAGQLRRSGRSKRTAVDQGCSSTGTQSSSNTDPFARLHRDVLNLILQYLSPRDLTCCGCVSNSWRDTIHWWVAAFGFRVHFPHLSCNLQQAPNTAIWEAFKVQTRQQHCIQSGKLASMQEFSFPSYYDMTIVGNFVVGRANAHELHLSWHQLAVPGGAVLHTKEIPLKKVWRVHVVLMYLEMNHEGMLLLRLRETGKDRARSAVYSPIDGKTVWRQDHRHKDPRYGVPGELTPLLIGRSVLHCARRGSNRDTFDLVGIDFRASNPTVIYETSVVGRRHWAHNKFCRRLVLIGEQHELVVLSDNEQWVGTGTISILSGENGQLLFQFDGGPAHFLGHKTVAYPTINQFSIQTVPARIRLNDAVQPWEAHAKVVKDFIIIETFLITFSGSDNSTISILRLGTDVVLSPCSIHKIAIQPFAKVAVALQSDDNTILSDRILSHPLVETNKTHLIQMAEAVLQASCPQHSDPPSLRHCFILQEPGIKINLRPSFSQPGPLAAAQDIRMRSLGGFVDGGRLLLEASETQVLLQF